MKIRSVMGGADKTGAVSEGGRRGMFKSKFINYAILLGMLLVLFFSPSIASGMELVPDNPIECSMFVQDYHIRNYPLEADCNFWLFNVDSDKRISQLTFKVISLSDELGYVRARDEYDFISVKVLDRHEVEDIPKLANYYVHTLQIEFDDAFENGFHREFIHFWYHAEIADWVDDYLMLYIPIYLQDTNVRNHGTVTVSGQGIEINFEAPDNIMEAQYSDYSLSDDNSHLNVFYFNDKLDNLTESSGYILEVPYTKTSLSPKQIWDQYQRIEEILRQTERSSIIALAGIIATTVAAILAMAIHAKRSARRTYRGKKGKKVEHEGEKTLVSTKSPTVFTAMNRLDNLLLFLPLSVGILLNIISSIGGAEWMIYFVPGLIPILIMPIYVGYIDGTILHDSLAKRVQGWIYFISGFIFYMISYTNIYNSEVAAKIYGKSASLGTTLAIVIPLMVSWLLIVVLTIFAIKGISKKIFEMGGRKVPTRTHDIFILITVVKSLVLVGGCYAFALFLGPIYNQNIEFWYSIITIAFTFGFFIIFKLLGKLRPKGFEHLQ